MRSSAALAATAVLLAATGCIPLTHMSAAPTVKPGHFEVMAGANTVSGEGSGGALNFGVRVGLAPRLDAGFIEDALSTNMDLKVHAVTDEMAGFDLSLSAGVGFSILAAYNYWNIVFSRQIGNWEPYIAYRNTYISEDKTDPGDDSSGVENVVYTLITSAVRDLNQFFVGTEYEMSGRTRFVIEGMILPSDDTADLVAINAGFKFKF